MSRPIPPKDAQALFEYPQNYPFIRVYVDEPRRVSTCQGCHGSIKKKTKRVVFTMVTWGRTYKNGGHTSQQRFFLHAACAKKVFADLTRPDDVHEKCWDCAGSLNGDGQPVCVGTRSAWATLCLNCAKEPRYRKCDSCRVIFTKYQTSMLAQTPEWWTAPKGDPSFVCDYCADADGLVTVKDIKRMARSERLFQERYERVVNAIQRGEMFGGPAT